MLLLGGLCCAGRGVNVFKPLGGRFWRHIARQVGVWINCSGVGPDLEVNRILLMT